MKRAFRPGRYANVTSTIALVVALGGTGAYAANTIRSGDIVNGQVKSVDIGTRQVKNADLATSAVTSLKVRNGTLLAKDFKAGQLPAGATGATGAPGAPGTPGTKGDKGDAGTPATRLFGVVHTTATEATLVRGAGITAVARNGIGDYSVTFNQSIVACTYLATAGNIADGGADANYVTVEQDNAAASPSVVQVRVYNAAGAPVDSATADGFHIAVFC